MFTMDDVLEICRRTGMEQWEVELHLGNRLALPRDRSRQDFRTTSARNPPSLPLRTHMFSFEPTEPTTELFIPRVLERTDCDKHNAPEGLYCFYSPPLEGKKWIGGICNSRARRAGFVGKISDQALQTGSKSRTSKARRPFRKTA